MKWKKNTWKYATAIVVIILTFNPGTVEFAIFVDVVGLDMLFLLFEVQIIAIAIFMFQISVQPVYIRISTFIKKIDPNFFISSWDIIIEYPPMIYHAIPFLVSTYWILNIIQ